jgi:hypothetical protein
MTKTRNKAKKLFVFSNFRVFVIKNLFRKCKYEDFKILGFSRDYARKKWPLRGSNSEIHWFQVSGFGCQEKEVLKADT